MADETHLPAVTQQGTVRMALFNMILPTLVVDLTLRVCHPCTGYGEPGTWVTLRTPGCKQIWGAITALQWVPNAAGA